MALNLTLTSFIIIAISIFAIIIGTVLILNITVFSKDLIETDLPTPYEDDLATPNTRIGVTVTPSASQEGTVFAVLADTWPPVDFQDLQLTIEKDTQQIPLTLYDDGQHQDGIANDGKFGAILDSQNFALGTYKIKSSTGEELSEFTLQDSTCQVLIGAPAYEKINFLILPYGYSSIDEFKQDAQNLILGTKTLSEIEPFKSNFDDLSFSFVEPIADLECEVGCRGVETMVCCNDAKVVDAASQCHYDQIIVLINSNDGCGTASFYTKLCAKSDLASLILTHELGHAFGGLADEYVYSDFFEYEIPQDYILQMPNCDVAGCPKWADISSDCYEGCTTPNLYRPSQNSIMRYVSYGSFNEVSTRSLQGEIQKRIEIESQLHQQNPQWKSYYVNLDYSNNEVKLSPAIALPVKPGVLSTKGFFTASVKDSQGEVLYETQLPLIPFESPALEISQKPLGVTKTILPVVLPFNPQAKSLEISGDNQILATTSLAVFTDRCGDKVCQASENSLSCSKDCKLEDDNFCQSTTCDPDCPNYDECELDTQTKENNLLLPIILVAFPTLVIIIILFRSKKSAI